MKFADKIKLILLCCALKDVSENTNEQNIKEQLQEIVTKMEELLTSGEEIKKALHLISDARVNTLIDK